MIFFARSTSIRLPYLCIGLLFLVQSYLHVNGYAPMATNYRIQDHLSTRSAETIAKSWAGLEVDTNTIMTGDDLGPIYLMAILLFSKYTKQELASEKELQVPILFFHLMSLPYLGFLCLLFFSLSRLVTPTFAATAAAIFLFSRTANFLAFSGMVYLFPALSIASILAWICLIRDFPRFWFLSSLATTLLLYFFDFFRTSSLPLLLAPLVILCAPRFFYKPAPSSMRKGAFVLLASWLLISLANPLASGHSKSLWNAVYLGLFESGGWIDYSTKTTYPSFVEPDSVPKGSEYRTRWSDTFYFVELAKVDPRFKAYEGYKSEYEEVFRGRVLYFAKNYPREILQLLGSRIWRMIVINPWQAMTHDSEIIFREPLDIFLRTAWILSLFAALCLGIYQDTFFRILCCMLLIGGGILLVHSGYMMYSFPFQAIAILLWLASIRWLFLYIPFPRVHDFYLQLVNRWIFGPRNANENRKSEAR